MSTIVYAVWSDRDHVDCIFTTRELAEEYVAERDSHKRYYDGDITAVDLYDEKPELVVKWEQVIASVTRHSPAEAEEAAHEAATRSERDKVAEKYETMKRQIWFAGDTLAEDTDGVG